MSKYIYIQPDIGTQGKVARVSCPSCNWQDKTFAINGAPLKMARHHNDKFHGSKKTIKGEFSAK